MLVGIQVLSGVVSCGLVDIHFVQTTVMGRCWHTYDHIEVQSVVMRKSQHVNRS